MKTGTLNWWQSSNTGDHHSDSGAFSIKCEGEGFALFYYHHRVDTFDTLEDAQADAQLCHLGMAYNLGDDPSEVATEQGHGEARTTKPLSEWKDFWFTKAHDEYEHGHLFWDTAAGGPSNA